MELSGYHSSNRVVRKVIREHADQVITLKQVPVYVGISPTETDIDFGGEGQAPRLRIEGSTTAVVPQTLMPFDIERINTIGNYDVAIDYDFSTEQLKSLVDKGLYLPGFTFDASRVLGAELVLGGLADIDIVPPLTPDGPPIVAVGLGFDDVHTMTLDNSGYDLEAELFDNYRAIVEENGLFYKDNEQEVAVAYERDDIFENEPEAEYVGECYGKSAPGSIGLNNAPYDRVAGMTLTSQGLLDEFAEQIRDTDGVVTNVGDTFGEAATRLYQEEIARKRDEFLAQREESFSERDELVEDSAEIEDDAWSQDVAELDDIDLDRPEVTVSEDDREAEAEANKNTVQVQREEIGQVSELLRGIDFDNEDDIFANMDGEDKGKFSHKKAATSKYDSSAARARLNQITQRINEDLSQSVQKKDQHQHKHSVFSDKTEEPSKTKDDDGFEF